MPEKPMLYHCPRTRSFTTLWMNEELGAPCDIKLINIRNGEQDKPEYLKINPMGKVPALSHDGVVTTEVAAICAYLVDAFPQKALAPSLDDPKRGAYFRWLFFSPSCIEPAMLDKFSGTVRDNPSSAGHGLIEDVLRMIDHALQDGPWLLGEQFTAADIVFGSTLNFAVMFGAFDQKPAYADYLERLLARAGYQAAQEKDNEWAAQMGNE